MFIGYERYRQPLAPRAVFLRRLGINAGVAGALIVVSLAAGMIGYHFIEGLGWLPAYVYAAMIVSGMGPLGEPPATAGGQLFAGTYALFCGLVLVATTGLVLAPVLHRLLHTLHLSEEDSAAADAGTGAAKPGTRKRRRAQ